MIVVIMYIEMTHRILMRRMVVLNTRIFVPLMDMRTLPISMIQIRAVPTSMLTVVCGRSRIVTIEHARNIGVISMMNVCGSTSELYVNSVNLLTRIKTVDIYA